MILETSRNIFRTGHRTLLNPCNGAGAMGAGLAKQFRMMSPEMYRQYQDNFPRVEDPAQMDRQRAFQLINVFGPKTNVLIFCTKFHWKEDADLFLIERNLKELNRLWDDLEIDSLALPAIGCGLGGLDYQSQVRPLIWQWLDHPDRVIEVCGLPRKQ